LSNTKAADILINEIIESHRAVKSEADWAEEVKRLLRAEMARRGITY
jgi:hypothetical protein